MTFVNFSQLKRFPLSKRVLFLRIKMVKVAGCRTTKSEEDLPRSVIKPDTLLSDHEEKATSG